MKKRTIQEIDTWRSRIRPRCSEADLNSYTMTDKLITDTELGTETAIVVNSGGAHSVAIGARLAELAGYQPIVMFDT